MFVSSVGTADVNLVTAQIICCGDDKMMVMICVANDVLMMIMMLMIRSRGVV